MLHRLFFCLLVVSVSSVSAQAEVRYREAGEIAANMGNFFGRRGDAFKEQSDDLRSQAEAARAGGEPIRARLLEQRANVAEVRANLSLRQGLAAYDVALRNQALANQFGSTVPVGGPVAAPSLPDPTAIHSIQQTYSELPQNVATQVVSPTQLQAAKP